MQKMSKGLIIFLSVFAGLALLWALNPTSLTYEVKGQFDSLKDFTITMTGCEFKPTSTYMGIREVAAGKTDEYEIHAAVVSNRIDCRSDKKNSIYWVRSTTSITKSK